MSIVALLDEIRDDLKAMPGINRVYDSVPEALNEFPALLVACMGGNTWLETHSGTIGWAHSIRVEIHIPRKNLPTDAAMMTALAGEIVPRLYQGFVTDRYNGTLVTPGGMSTGAAPALDYSIGPSEWSDQPTYAFMCDFTVTSTEAL